MHRPPRRRPARGDRRPDDIRASPARGSARAGNIEMTELSAATSTISHSPCIGSRAVVEDTAVAANWNRHLIGDLLAGLEGNNS